MFFLKKFLPWTLIARTRIAAFPRSPAAWLNSKDQLCDPLCFATGNYDATSWSIVLTVLSQFHTNHKWKFSSRLVVAFFSRNHLAPSFASVGWVLALVKRKMSAFKSAFTVNNAMYTKLALKYKVLC